ncbi:MAG: hypothetical protein FWD33_03900 [Alphaproteobacteria bacterium]|nr:hypothetical protein [Alphaproteobacteria bacterium]
MKVVRGCSREAIRHNIKSAIKEGKPVKQAVAIALSVADKNAMKCDPKNRPKPYVRKKK